jgi:hypothetical protein
MIVFKNFENEARSLCKKLIVTEGHRSISFTSEDSIGGSTEGGTMPMGKSDALIVFVNRLIE